MPKINSEYDIGAAFEAIENELIASMIRNMRRHKIAEIDEDKQCPCAGRTTPVVGKVQKRESGAVRCEIQGYQ